jgi:hypothetical protein
MMEHGIPTEAALQIRTRRTGWNGGRDSVEETLREESLTPDSCCGLGRSERRRFGFG